MRLLEALDAHLEFYHAGTKLIRRRKCNNQINGMGTLKVLMEGYKYAKA